MLGSIASSVSRVRAVDARILAWLHRHRSARLTRAMRVTTRLGSVEVLAPLSVVASLLLARRGEARSAGFVALTASVATAANLSLKALFGRARPDARLHLSQTSGFAFPSGHAMASAAIYGALALVARNQAPHLRWLARVLTATAIGAVGTSRAYLHVHYPSDVAAGWVLGAALPLAFKRLL
jgi:undecaprenyl-diphosphatase